MVGRYELSKAQWQRISPMLHGKPGDAGRSGSDNRLFVNGVLRVLRSGAHWQDLPPHHGKWKTVHKRFTRWAQAGVWERRRSRYRKTLSRSGLPDAIQM